MVPKLSEENDRFYFILSRILPGLHDGMGGFRYSAVETIFNDYGVTGGQRAVLWDRLIVYIQAWRDQKAEDREAEDREREQAKNNASN